MPFLILLPFLAQYVIPHTSLGFGVTWILTISFLILTSNYFTFFIKKLFVIKPAIIFVYLLVIVGFTYLDYNGYIIVSEYFKSGLLIVANNNYLLIFPALFLFTGFTSTYLLLKKNSYAEESLSTSKKSVRSASVLGFLDRYGNIGNLILLEIKLIARNKRPKTMTIMSIFFLLYGFMFYTTDTYFENPLFLVGMGIFITGVIMINHGQLMFSWESSYYDFLLARPVNIREFLEAKFWLYSAAMFFAFLITLPYAFFNFKIAFYNLAAILFNIGFNIYLLMYINAFNTKRVDLTKGAMFNYEGAGVAQFLLIIPLIGIPVVVVYLFDLFDYATSGVLFLGFAGLSGIVFKDKIIHAIATKLRKRKYIMSKGFKEK